MDTTIEQQRAEHYALFCEVLPELVQRLTWSRAEIEAFQGAKLRQLLAHAVQHAPWHAQRLKHLDPATVTLADLAKITPMTKHDLMQHWDDIVTVPGATRAEAEAALRGMRDQFYIWDGHVLFTSGGTGGQPGIFLYDRLELAVNWGGTSRSITSYVNTLPLKGNPHPHGVTIVAIGAETSGHGSFVCGRIFANPLNSVYLLSGWRSAEELVPKLNAIKPHMITCYPNLLAPLANAARAGTLDIAPQAIACGGEHFPDRDRILAQETWPDTQILNYWGTSEGGGTFPCPCGDGFHVSEDLVIIEPVDADGRPVGPGERSAGIYFTNLYNLSMPIIRYYIDDVFEMADGPCACGSHFKKVRQVHGRAFERFHYGPIAVHPVTLQLAVLEQPQILEYQFRQTPNGAELLFRSNDPVDTARLTAKMKDALESFGLHDPDVSAERVEELERSQAGKLKRFVPLPQA